MQVQAVNIDLEILGARFANMGSREQAKFFKGLSKELQLWPSQHQIQMQFFYIANKLDESDKATLENALGCLWYKEEKGK